MPGFFIRARSVPSLPSSSTTPCGLIRCRAPTSSGGSSSTSCFRNRILHGEALHDFSRDAPISRAIQDLHFRFQSRSVLRFGRDLLIPSRRAPAAGALLLLLLCGPLPLSAQAPEEPPRLVLQITVDQLRGDLPTRYFDRLGEGGLRYLWESGTVYADAHHSHANTETIVGHTTLATGAYPAVHGMIGNTSAADCGRGRRRPGRDRSDSAGRPKRGPLAGGDHGHDVWRRASKPHRGPCQGVRGVGEGPWCRVDGRSCRQGVLVLQGSR